MQREKKHPTKRAPAPLGPQATPKKKHAGEVGLTEEAEEILSKVLATQMEVVNIQGNNNWSQVMHIVAKTKKAVQQIAEDDPLLYQVGNRLNDYKTKMLDNAQKAKDRAEDLKFIRSSTASLHEKILALRPK